MTYFLIFHIYYNFLVLELVIGPTDNTYETIGTLKLQYASELPGKFADLHSFPPSPHSYLVHGRWALRICITFSVIVKEEVHRFPL